MAFWKRSDDPWDVDPGKARERWEREPIENPLDTLKSWNEDRRVKAAARQAEWEAQPKEVCPWCGKEMERGCLEGGRGVYWYPGRHTASAAWWGPSAIEDSFQVDEEGNPLKGTYKTAWYCRACGKMTLSMEKRPSAETSAPSGGTCAPEHDEEDAEKDGEAGE